jgi:translation initiation factor 4E
VLAVIGEVLEDACDVDHSMTDHINGIRVVDKSRGTFPMYKLEVWLNTREPATINRIKHKVLEVMADGQSANAKKMHPKFDWKDHSG